MNYTEAISYLNSLSRFGWRLGLERMESLCERLDHPERSFQSIQVVGTNGKGSTATYLAAILSSAGYRTGLYTSPHLYSGLERIRVDGAAIREEDVCRYIDELAPHIEAVSRLHGPVTEFEAWTMVMLLHFRGRRVGVAVVEAGLGGRWDSTNVLPSRLGIITNVSLDHMDRLGNTVAEIARDKAGILKSGSRAIVGPLSPEAHAEVSAEARATSTPIYSLVPSGESAPPGWPHYSWRAAGEALELCSPAGSEAAYPYSGPRYGMRNAAMAAAAAGLLVDKEEFHIPGAAVTAGLSVSIPGRFEIIQSHPEVILDGAHNPAAAAVLAAELARTAVDRVADGEELVGPPGDLRLVFGSSGGHDGEACLRVLAPLAREVILTKAENSRSRDPMELARELPDLGVPFEIIPNVVAAVETAIRRSAPGDRVCVTGSFFVLGEAPRAVPAAKAG